MNKGNRLFQNLYYIAPTDRTEKNLEYGVHAQHAQGPGFKSQQNTEFPFRYAVFIHASTSPTITALSSLLFATNLLSSSPHVGLLLHLCYVFKSECHIHWKTHSIRLSGQIIIILLNRGISSSTHFLASDIICSYFVNE